MAIPSWLLAGPGSDWLSATRSPNDELVEPAAAFDVFAPEVADVGDGPAERGKAEAQGRQEDLARRPAGRAAGHPVATAAVGPSVFGTIISGRPVTTSQAGRMMTQRSGRIDGSLTMRAAMKRASQPLRVTATRIPMRLAETATASGIWGIRAFTNRPMATPAKTDGKIRPPRKPQVPATTTAIELDHDDDREPAGRVVPDRRVSSFICWRPLNRVIGPPMAPRMPRMTAPATIATNADRIRWNAAWAIGKA